MILFFDTETSGLFDFRLPADNPAQPHIVQLAAQLCEEGGRAVATVALIVNPGIEVPTAAANIHGITTEHCARFGVPVETALTLFGHLYQRCDLIVGHNVDFDKGMIEAAAARQYGRARPLTKPSYCTMKSATEIVGIRHDKPRRDGEPPGLKWPRLNECIRHFFDEDLPDAHDALVDVLACKRVYFALNPNGE